MVGVFTKIAKNVIDFTSFGILLLLAKKLPKLALVLKLACNMKTFDFLAIFKQLLLLILLSLAHAGKGKRLCLVICKEQFRAMSQSILFCRFLQRTRPPRQSVVKE